MITIYLGILLERKRIYYLQGIVPLQDATDQTINDKTNALFILQPRINIETG